MRLHTHSQMYTVQMITLVCQSSSTGTSPSNLLMADTELHLASCAPLTLVTINSKQYGMGDDRGHRKCGTIRYSISTSVSCSTAVSQVHKRSQVKF